MQRIPEVELMDDPEQTLAYARADFSEPHNHFVALFREHFAEVRYECFWFFTLLIFMRFYLVEGVDPNKERYWKKIITDLVRREMKGRSTGLSPPVRRC